MSHRHAVIRIDQAHALVLQLDSHPPLARRLEAHRHPTRRHASAARTGHEFLAEVCAAVDDVDEILVVGGHQALADFEHYVRKHRPETAARIVGNDVVDQPSQSQLAAHARRFFERRAHLADIGALPGG
ncbi:MAG: hypothetical protein ACTHL8_14470 [Burkholderiaceae bacterium]